MPRKTRRKSLLKSQKPPLQFVEPPLDGARYHNVPQVWGAINPKSFQFEEQQSTSSTASNYWVNPQFEKLPPSVPQGRRGRKACIAASNILDKSSQLLRKTSVSKFPSLSFARSTAQPLHHKRAHVTNTLECAVGAKQSLHVHEVCSLSNQSFTTTPKQRTSVRERSADKRLLSEVTPEGDASSGNVPRPIRCPATCTGLIPVPMTHTAPGTDNVLSPPDVETPELHRNGSSFSLLHFLLPSSQPMTPPQTLDSEVLAADTPERDYGVKVTWRRRKGLMRLLRDRGNLSNAETFFSIQ